MSPRETKAEREAYARSYEEKRDRAQVFTDDAENALHSAWEAWSALGCEYEANACLSALRLIPGRRP